MKTRMLSLLAAALILVSGVPSLASAAESDATAQLGMEELATHLDLTADQQSRIAPALEERNTRILALRSNFEASSSRREKLKALREARSIQQEFVRKVSPILTSEQKAEWEELREEARSELKNRMKNRE